MAGKEKGSANRESPNNKKILMLIYNKIKGAAIKYKIFKRPNDQPKTNGWSGVKIHQQINAGMANQLID